MFGILKDMVQRVYALDERELFTEVMQDPILQAQVLDLNTDDQLFEKGEDSLGRKLADVGGGYSPYTIMLKKIKGQPVDRVTLKDTGEFYSSFRLSVGFGYIEITADPFKDGDNINTEWGGYVIGLNSENKEWLANEIKHRLIELVRERIAA